MEPSQRPISHPFQDIEKQDPSKFSSCKGFRDVLKHLKNLAARALGLHIHTGIAPQERVVTRAAMQKFLRDNPTEKIQGLSIKNTVHRLAAPVQQVMRSKGYRDLVSYLMREGEAENLKDSEFLSNCVYVLVRSLPKRLLKLESEVEIEVIPGKKQKKYSTEEARWKCLKEFRQDLKELEKELEDSDITISTDDASETQEESPESEQEEDQTVADTETPEESPEPAQEEEQPESEADSDEETDTSEDTSEEISEESEESEETEETEETEE